MLTLPSSALLCKPVQNNLCFTQLQARGVLSGLLAHVAHRFENSAASLGLGQNGAASFCSTGCGHLRIGQGTHLTESVLGPPCSGDTRELSKWVDFHPLPPSEQCRSFPCLPALPNTSAHRPTAGNHLSESSETFITPIWFTIFVL